MNTDKSFFVGVDLGQRRDFTAIAVVERITPVKRGFDHLLWMATEETAADEWVVRHAERIRLGTPYTDVVRRVVEVARRVTQGGECRLVVDATGVGMPVVDMLRAAGPGCGMEAVVLTGGQSDHFDGRVWRAPKLDLLARLQTLLEGKRLRIARGAREARTLVRELLDVRVKRQRNGRVRVGAEGVGEHDDLVLAVALAVWPGRKGRIGDQGKRLPCR